MRSTQPEIDVDVVLRHLRYDPRTGEIRWKIVPRLSRKAKVGEIADYATTNGYRVVYLYGRWIYSHRIAWATAWMKWPPGAIDHVNMDPGDNTWWNLRLATRSQNQANHRRRVDNRSGIKGVSWNRQQSKWKVTVKLHGKDYHGGFFENLDDAALAIKILRKKLHGEFANHG